MDQKKNTLHAREWALAKEELIGQITKMGYPASLGDAIAKNLGSPKAMQRMTRYLIQAKPRSAEEIVDEMLAIQSEIAAWRGKKDAEFYNAQYNLYLEERRQE